MKEWVGIYLKNATERVNGMLEGGDLEFSAVDVYTIQQTCAYEVC